MRGIGQSKDQSSDCRLHDVVVRPSGLPSPFRRVFFWNSVPRTGDIAGRVSLDCRHLRAEKRERRRAGLRGGGTLAVHFENWNCGPIVTLKIFSPVPGSIITPGPCLFIHYHAMSRHARRYNHHGCSFHRMPDSHYPSGIRRRYRRHSRLGNRTRRSGTVCRRLDKGAWIAAGDSTWRSVATTGRQLL